MIRHTFYKKNHQLFLQVLMDSARIFGLAVIITGLAIVAANGLAIVYHWSSIPPNVFIIGLGLVVIGLVLIWNSGKEITS